ncbi:4Fe-4S binding protein, partial [Shigella boydii]
TTACPWMMATVNTESKKSSKCVLCGECANACPTGALKIIEWKDITVRILQRKKSWLTVGQVIY